MLPVRFTPASGSHAAPDTRVVSPGTVSPERGGTHCARSPSARRRCSTQMPVRRALSTLARLHPVTFPPGGRYDGPQWLARRPMVHRRAPPTMTTLSRTEIARPATARRDRNATGSRITTASRECDWNGPSRRASGRAYESTPRSISVPKCASECATAARWARGRSLCLPIQATLTYGGQARRRACAGYGSGLGSVSVGLRSRWEATG